MAQQCKFREMKDFLQSYLDNKPPAKGPSGAVPSVWMTLPPTPKNHFDEVYPNLFLGDYYVAKDKEKLADIKVTHLVNCAQGTKFNQINTSQEFFEDVRIKFHGIKALDIATFQIKKHFQEAADFIDGALHSGGCVYIHCQSGMSRSGSIVLSFLMLKRDMDVMAALKTVRAKREIFPNDGFLRQLAELDEELYGNKMTEETQ